VFVRRQGDTAFFGNGRRALVCREIDQGHDGFFETMLFPDGRRDRMLEPSPDRLHATPLRQYVFGRRTFRSYAI
jgi:hypothetical protein